MRKGLLLTYMTFLLFSYGQGYCQKAARQKATLCTLLAGGNFSVDSTTRHPPLYLLPFRSVAYLVAYPHSLVDYGFLSFGNKTTRRILCTIKKGATCVVVYNHGGVGNHAHLLVMNPLRGKFHLYDFSGYSYTYRGFMMAAKQCLTATEAESVLMDADEG